MNENVYSEQNAVIEEDTQNASAKQDNLNINISDRSEISGT